MTAQILYGNRYMFHFDLEESYFIISLKKEKTYLTLKVLKYSVNENKQIFTNLK